MDTDDSIRGIIACHTLTNPMRCDKDRTINLINVHTDRYFPFMLYV